MTTDIFIRTYHKDIQWLGYALESIHKYCKGFNKIIICIPSAQRHLLDHLTYETIIECPNYKRDYIGQQVSKLNAYKFSDADNIMFTDSDCIFSIETSPSNFFMIDDKPFLLKTKYEKVGDAICWKKPTEQAFGAEIKYEYMRRLPLLFKRSTLQKLDEHFSHFGGVGSYAISQESISEFNLIGAFAELYTPEDYRFLDTDEIELPISRIRQFWSHDGVLPFINEINQILHK